GFLAGAGAVPPLANVRVGVIILTRAQQKWLGSRSADWMNHQYHRCITLPDGSISFSSLPDEQPTNPPWKPASEIYPHDGNTPTTMTNAATTTYPTWGNVDLNPTTTTTYPSPETASTTTVQTTTMTTETTTQWTPPMTADWVPPTTMQQDPWGQQSTSGPPRGQQTQNPMQTFFGQPGGNGGPSLVVINNM
uniref:Uncharacterized protein n=1 Tax=Romanomermis culicivorax TaxID=13658 RepID=A0A915IWL4_ROMCU